MSDSNDQRATPPGLPSTLARTARETEINADFTAAHDNELAPEREPELGSEQVETDAPTLELMPPDSELTRETHYRNMSRDAARAEAQTAFFKRLAEGRAQEKSRDRDRE